MNLTISSLLTAYRNGSLSPEQLIDHIDAQCAEYVSHNIWIHRLTREELQPYLDRLAKHSPDDLPLYGIPFAIKDNIDLADVPTTAACPDFAYTPEHSAFVVQQLIDAGAIPIGKANMDQFATGLVGTRSPEPWGPCRNAFNPDYISGGSSSGSAVAVSLGLVSFSLGTDTAGSGRVPAAFNNLIGVKPSRGLLSTSGVVPACRTLDCVTIFAFNTDDANRVMSIAAAYDEGDDYARHNPFDNLPRHYGIPEGSFSFGVPSFEQLEFFGNESARQLFEESISRLTAMGGIARTIDFTPFLDAAKLLYEGPWVAERYVAIEDFIKEQPNALLPVINTIIGGAELLRATAAFKAEYRMQHFRKVTTELLSDIDFLVTPTTGTIYTIDEVNADPIKLNSNLGYYTNYMNLLDCASVAVPAGFLDNGLPWGITFVSAAFSDNRLLSYAKRWQQQLGLTQGKVGYELAMHNNTGNLLPDRIPLIVCGAHLSGLALNWQLTERGATLLEKTTSSPRYRLYALEGGPPYRPGMIRDETEGSAIEIEIWSVPKEQFGSFVAQIPAPLGIGKVETSDGRWLPGFICENHAISYAKEITELGGWRKYVDTM